jgi:hypothetical protein
MNSNQLTERIEIAAGALRAATEKSTAARGAVSVAARAAQSAREEVLLAYSVDPKALGVNEATREAKLRELTAPQQATLIAAQEAAQEAEAALSLARVDWDEVCYLVCVWHSQEAV